MEKNDTNHGLQEINKALFVILYPKNIPCPEDIPDYWDIPDYCADPRLVIEAMREDKEIDFDSFLVECGSLSRHGRHLDCILLDLILDKTGRLAKLATEWIERSKPCLPKTANI